MQNKQQSSSTNDPPSNKDLQSESLQQCTDKLRDVYMNYKDLAHRCLIDIKQVEKGERRVFYFKPETFLLDDPEKQRIYREKLLKKITTVPVPEPITYIGDELHKQLIETVQDRSQPGTTRNMLAQYFKRKQYTLQHKKYKVLIRWAHHALTTEYIERIGQEATFKYGKIEYDMENAMSRFDRLDGDDDYESALQNPPARPNTKAKEGGSLYVENTDLEAVSAIRTDDIEVYFRQVTYEQKINKCVNKFITRLKWLPLYKRYDIWQDAVEGYNQIKENNLKAQEKLLERIKQRAEETIGQGNDQVTEEVNDLLDSYFVKKYKSKILGKAEQIINSQKSDNEIAPLMIDNSIELKIHILDKSLCYGIYGDIELDQGYSFAYQITIFFPTYFQRQIIKAQFSVYDAFAGEEADQNSIQKRNLTQMAKIDTNIFRDISTTKNNIPSQESLDHDKSFLTIKVIRLKSSSTWIDYICMFPTIPDYIQKQAAILSTNNPIDSLLKSAMNFLDVNDLSTVNRILEESARLHQQQQKQAFNSKDKKKKQKSDKQDQSNQSQNKQDQKIGQQNEHKLIRDHFTSALKGEVHNEQKDPLKDMSNINKNSIRYMPQHLIHAYYILRHMRQRDYKTQLLYCLNYFRSIQKRLMLDLREFGTRERVMGDVIQPIIPSEEADKVSQQNANANYFKKQPEAQQIHKQTTQDNNSSFDINNTYNSDKTNQKYQQQLLAAEKQQQKDKNYSIFDNGLMKNEQSLVDMKKFKFKGKFNNKIFSTCPVLPRYHATFGEPVEFQPLNVEMERVGQIKHATDESIKLMGRIDHVEIDEANKEVYIKDDFGIYILYECALQDMKDLEDELLKIGSYYISKHEFLINTEGEKPYPLVDRMTLLEDLLESEREFQFQKVILIQNYMECYEHISDPLESQRLMQIVTDLMAQRPRLNTLSTYFKDSYTAESQCLKNHQDLVREIIYQQMQAEKEENKRIQSYLDLTYRIANEQNKGKWSYSDPEDFFNELKKRKAMIRFMNGGTSVNEDTNTQNIVIPEESKNETQSEQDVSPTKRFLQKINSKQHNSKYSQQQKLQNENNAEAESENNGFAAVLGLPPITVESLYMQYKEKDETILDIMNEHANFIRVYEGYPEFMVELQAFKSSKLGQFKVTPWSLPINLLDFYDSLSFVNKLYSTLKSVFDELVDALKPHDATLLTMIESNIIARAIVEYKKTRAYLEGSIIESKGMEYIEDESIVGNPDKISFYMKDLVAHLTKTLKQNIDPFYIGKLDVETINFFDFQAMPNENHPFKSFQPQLNSEFTAAIKIAEANTRQNESSYQRFFPQLKEYMRKINIPSLLTLSCNAVELLRLRQELLFNISESSLLQEVYESQCKLVNRQNFKVLFNDKINFDNYLIDQTKVNWIDDGAATFLDIDLAINEFDPILKSNLNFRSSDAFKMLICTSGLEELRAVLHYQIMQKQLLIIGVRLNQLLIDTHVRALNELELIKKGYSLPNMIIKLQNILSKSGDGFSHDGFQKERQRYQTNLVNEAAQVFYAVASRKTKLRNTVSKKFQVFLTTATSTYGKVECSLRVLRSYKIKLLHSYCKEVLKEAYHDAVKIQAIHSCQRLRTAAQYFAIDEQTSGFSSSQEKPQLFKFEIGEYFENFFASYNPSYTQEVSHHAFQKSEVSVQFDTINSQKMEIMNYWTIPSTIAIAKLEPISYEELRLLNEKIPSFDFISDLEDNDPEQSIKQALPILTEIQTEYPREDYEKDRTGLRVVDFAESYDYSSTQFAQIFHYYALLERLMHIELFKSKMQTSLLDSIQLDECIQNGLPFWGVDQNDEVNNNAVQNGIDIYEESLAEKILNKIVALKRAKVNLADDIISAATRIKVILTRIQNPITNQTGMSKSRVLEYIIINNEVRFYLVLNAFEKLIDQFYQKGYTKEVKILSEFYLQFTKRDSVLITYNQNSFHANIANIRSGLQQLDSSNLIQQYSFSEEQNSFQRCIQPIVNEQAMNPPQITIYESMFLTPRFKSTQFAGQIPHSYQLYRPLQTGLINLGEKERMYLHTTAFSIRGFMKDYLEVIHKETTDINDSMTLDQYRKCKKILTELICARQLKNALICWIANSTLPLDPAVYNQYQQLYKNDVFWKIMNQKDQLPQINSLTQASSSNVTRQFSSMANKEELDQQKSKESNKRIEQSMLLSQQLQTMQTQALVDQVQTCKAEIIVLAQEIEKQIVKAAITAVDQEANALSSCFSMSVKQIDMHIHPFQQFASTLYAPIDPNSHLDLVTKIAEVQKFITKLRNRGTEVETLTSGPGMVFTIKDFNECLQILCRSLVKYSEKELRSRSEDLAKKESFYIQQLYIKDRQIANMEERINNTRENLDKIINSKMYEKGNQLIYELDSVNRQLRLFKDNVYSLESELRANIRAEFADTIRKNMREIETNKNKFKDFKTDVTTKVKADLVQEQYHIQKVLKKKAEEFKNLAISTVNRSQPRGPSPPARGQAQSSPRNKILSGGDSNNAYEDDDVNNMTEREARQELAKMWEMMRKLRLFWKTKEVLTIDKYEREIFTMKKQQTSNACLWEQLAEAEKREKVLKQELIFTQQSLAASEKVIEKLKDDLRKSESDRIRLNQYKTNKQQRLDELEGKVRKFEVLENINLEKLIDTLGSKEKEIEKLKDIEKNFNQKLDVVEKRKDMEIRDINYKYQKEQNLKQDVLGRLESLRMELRMLEKNEGSMSDVWKTKCKELVEICNKLKIENDTINGSLMMLMQQQSHQQQNNIATQQQYQQNYSTNQEQNAYQHEHSGSNSGAGPYTQLPKLMQNQSQIKMMANINSSKYGAGSVRQSSVHRHEYANMSSGDKSFNEKQLLTGSKNQAFHTRGKSLYDPTLSQSKDNQIIANKNNNIFTGFQSKKDSFQIMGSQAQIAQASFKGFQSVRTSQVGGTVFKGNNDLLQYMGQSDEKPLKRGLVDMSQTATTFSKTGVNSVRYQIGGGTKLNDDRKSDITSDMRFSSGLPSIRPEQDINTEKKEQQN